MIIDFPFLIAAAAFGWGLSLATYRLFAFRYDWPMGEWQSDRPVLPILIGVTAIVLAFAFAALRGTEFGGWWILLAGLLWAIFWTGFMRVGSQVSLFLAPIASLLLVLNWIGLGWSPDPGLKSRRLSGETSPAPWSTSSPLPAPRQPSIGNDRATTTGTARRREDPEFMRR